MTGRKPPSLMDVMRHMAHLRDTMPKVSVYEISKQTCDVITVYWRMAKIPVQELSDTKKKTYCAAYRLSKLWQEYQTVKSHRNRKTESEIQKRADMTFQLSLLFCMAHPRVKEIIMADTTRTPFDKEMDIEFLKDQKFDRKMVMGNQDWNYKKRYEKKLRKLLSEEERVHRWEEEKAAVGNRKRAAADTTNDDDDTDQDFVPKQQKLAKSKYCPVLLPRKILAGTRLAKWLTGMQQPTDRKLEMLLLFFKMLNLLMGLIWI